MRKILLSAALGIASLIIVGAAQAAPACTAEPKTKWLTQTQMRLRVEKLGYTKIKVLQVSGSCYEIYAQNKAGKKAEVYFNPVTGAVVQNNED